MVSKTRVWRLRFIWRILRRNFPHEHGSNTGVECTIKTGIEEVNGN
jgi:hypothetical protein